MEWTVKLEAKDGWGEVQTFEAGRLSRHVQGLTADEIGLTLDEAKALLAELQRRMVETQIKEKCRAASNAATASPGIRPILPYT
jgi:hypothetical protein